MYHRPITHNCSDGLVADPVAPLRRFVTDHFDGLRNAGELLAGRRGARLVDNILDRLGRESEPSRSTWAALRDLLGILTLENVHDEDRPEAAHFAAIDPASPVVTEVCLLTDGFRDALDAATRERAVATTLRAVA